MLATDAFCDRKVSGQRERLASYSDACRVSRVCQSASKLGPDCLADDTRKQSHPQSLSGRKRIELGTSPVPSINLPLGLPNPHQCTVLELLPHRKQSMMSQTTHNLTPMTSNCAAARHKSRNANATRRVVTCHISRNQS